mmetsp:Transcript_63799/g.120827  ORF Transcript_63799/g.120827 Transcript_63799/m.120827 type:complete len:1119 (-) Transcript_63799:109-3465(-)
MFKRLHLPSFGGRTPRGSTSQTPRASCISDDGVLPIQESKRGEEQPRPSTGSEDLSKNNVKRIASVGSADTAVSCGDAVGKLSSIKSIGRQKSLTNAVSSVVGFVKGTVTRRRTVAVTSTTSSKKIKDESPGFGLVSSLVKDPLQSSLDTALKSNGANEGVHWTTKILTDTEIRDKLKESSKNLVTGFMEHLATVVKVEMPDLDFKTRNQLTVWLEEEMVSGLHKIGMRVFEACQNLRDTHARMQQRVKEAEEKMTAMNMQYLREITQRRDKNRPGVSFQVEQACGGPLDGSTGEYDFYEPLLYMPQDTRGHVIAIVEEKLKQVFCANPKLKEMCDGHQLVKQMNDTSASKLNSAANRIQELEKENNNLQERLKAAEATRANVKRNNFKLQEKHQRTESEMMKVRGENLQQKRRVSELLVATGSLSPASQTEDGAASPEEEMEVLMRVLGTTKPEEPPKPFRRSFRESIVWQHVRELTVRVKVQTEELLAQYTNVEDVKRKLEQAKEAAEMMRSRNQALELALAGSAFVGESDLNKLGESASTVFSKPEAPPQVKEGKRRSVVSEAKSPVRKQAGGKRLSRASTMGAAPANLGAANPLAAAAESSAAEEARGAAPAESKSGEAAPAEEKSGDKVTISAVELQQVVLNNKVLTTALQDLKREGEELAAKLSAAMEKSGRQGDRYSFLHSDDGSSVFKRLLQAVDNAGGHDVLEVLARVESDGGGGRPPGSCPRPASERRPPPEEPGQSCESAGPSIAVESCCSPHDSAADIGMSALEERPRPSIIPEGCESHRPSLLPQPNTSDNIFASAETEGLEEDRDDPGARGMPEGQVQVDNPSSNRNSMEEKAPMGFDMQVCACGNVLMPDALFCRKCGTKRGDAMVVPVAEVATQVCPCGNTLLPDAVFCRKCGVKRPSLERTPAKPPEAAGQSVEAEPSSPPPSRPPESSPKAAPAKPGSVRQPVRRGGSFLGGAQSGMGAVMGADTAPAAAFASAKKRTVKGTISMENPPSPNAPVLLELNNDATPTRTEVAMSSQVLELKPPTNKSKPRPQPASKGPPEAQQAEMAPSGLATVGSGKWRTLQKQNTLDLDPLRGNAKAKSTPFQATGSIPKNSRAAVPKA